MSKASLETLARTMSIGLLAIAVSAVVNQQVQPAAALPLSSNAVVKEKTTTKKILASRSRAPRELASRGVWLKSLLHEAGFRGKYLHQAWAVAMKESTGRPLAYNGNRSSGDHSYGIFQINMIGSLGADRREKFGIKSNKELFNPLTNAKAAYYMSAHGTNWKSWDIDKSGYNGGVSAKAYRYWLARYPKG